MRQIIETNNIFLKLSENGKQNEEIQNFNVTIKEIILTAKILKREELDSEKEKMIFIDTENEPRILNNLAVAEMWANKIYHANEYLPKSISIIKKSRF